jgi:predicted dehydrogenase
MSIKVGLIGYKNQAVKLQYFFETKKCEITKIYHPTKNSTDIRFTNNFADLYENDVVIIASPNNSHFKYIRKLLDNFSGYIFCEKPPVTNMKDLKYLEKISKKSKNRLFFNFNLRFGELNKKIQNKLKSKKIGKPIFINIVSSKGLAFKEEYLNSWRSDGKNNLHNILDAVTIHFIDLLGYNFGEIINYNYTPMLCSKRGSSFDTAQVILKFKNSLTVSIFNSYATPLYNEFSVFGTNGILTFNSKKVKIISPRDTFDSNFFFKTPPIKYSQNFSFDKDFYQSTENSIKYFLKHVKNKKPIDTTLFDISMASNKIILNLKKQR